MRELRKKIRSPQSLKRQLAALRRARGGRAHRFVFTNGCFDLLHKGHVSYLEQARKLGTGLIVALNADESVKRLKGEDRPINRLADRMEVIAALESVDYVTWFDEDTPLELIRLLLPDVLVKGGDWKPSQMIGADVVLAKGGKVRSLKYVQGRSTTEIIRRARGSGRE
jgi:rfaE bifunctional protein nucleotidyltransferase chain/domain